MRLAIVGQQAFGKSVLEAFLSRDATVAGVFCAPEKPGDKPDPLRLAAQEREGMEKRNALAARLSEEGIQAKLIRPSPHDSFGELLADVPLDRRTTIVFLAGLAARP